MLELVAGIDLARRATRSEIEGTSRRPQRPSRPRRVRPTVAAALRRTADVIDTSAAPAR